MQKLPYSPRASQNMFMPGLDMPEKLSYGQKTLTIHCDEALTIKPQFTRPASFVGRSAARQQLKRAGNPTRKQRRMQHEIREAIAKERTWLR